MDMVQNNFSWRMYVLLITCVMLCMNQAKGNVVINEIKLWGNPLFIELKMKTSDTTVKSHNYTAVIYNSTDISYKKVIKHSSMISSFYIEDLAKKDLPDSNGTYAVALYWRNSSVEDQNFVNITTVDAVVYRFTKNDDSNLGILLGLNRTESYLVNVSANTSLSKCGGSYQLTTPTPNANNNCSDSTGRPKPTRVSTPKLSSINISTNTIITAASTALPSTPVLTTPGKPTSTTIITWPSTSGHSSPSPSISPTTVTSPTAVTSTMSGLASTAQTSSTLAPTVSVAPTNGTTLQSTISPLSSSLPAAVTQSTATTNSSNSTETLISDHTDDKSKVTIGVVVSCIAMFLLVVLVVVLCIKRRRTGINMQFRMTRLEEDDDLVGPDINDFNEDQGMNFSNPFYSSMNKMHS